jgi:hypothetical protein
MLLGQYSFDDSCRPLAKNTDPNQRRQSDEEPFSHTALTAEIADLREQRLEEPPQHRLRRRTSEVVLSTKEGNTSCDNSWQASMERLLRSSEVQAAMQGAEPSSLTMRLFGLSRGDMM